MTFLGIDLHTSCFTCWYLDSKTGNKRIETFKLNDSGLSLFYKTLNRRTHVLVDATARAIMARAYILLCTLF